MSAPDEPLGPKTTPASEITLPLLWQAVQDLKKDPLHQNKPLAHLVREALNQLEFCYYCLKRPPNLSEKEFAALQVNDTIYAHLSSPIAKAHATRDLVPVGPAAISITQNRRKAQAVQRLHEFVLLLPTLDSRAWPSFSGHAPEELWKNWNEQGIPRPLISNTQV